MQRYDFTYADTDFKSNQLRIMKSYSAMGRTKAGLPTEINSAPLSLAGRFTRPTFEATTMPVTEAGLREQSVFDFASEYRAKPKFAGRVAYKRLSV